MSIWLLLLLEEVSNQKGKTCLLRVTLISKAPLGDCIAACPIAASGSCCCKIFPIHSVRHGVLLPSTGDDACVSPVRQDLELLVSFRTKRNFPSPPAKDFPRSSAIHTLIWFTVMWSFGRVHGIFVENASAPQSHWVRVVTILSSSSWYKFKIVLIKNRRVIFQAMFLLHTLAALAVVPLEAHVKQ